MAAPSKRGAIAAATVMVVLGVGIGVGIHHYALEPKVPAPAPALEYAPPVVRAQPSPTAVPMDAPVLEHEVPKRSIRKSVRRAPTVAPPSVVSSAPRTIEAQLAEMTELARSKRAEHPSRVPEIDVIVMDASIWARSRNRDEALKQLDALERALSRIE